MDDIGNTTVMIRAQSRVKCSPSETFDLTFETEADMFIEMYAYTWTDTLIHIGIMPFILSVGLLGNLAFLVVVAQIHWMRTITNLYLVNLALADIAFLVVSIGEKLHQYSSTPFIYDDFPKGPAGCILVPFIKDFCFFSSISLVTCISMERFNAACRPLKQRRDKGAKIRNRTAKLTICAWIISLVVASLRISASCEFRVYCLIWPDMDSYQDYPTIIGECRPPQEWISYFTKCIQLIPFILAMGINAVLYGKITRAVHCTTARPNARSVPSSTSVIEAKITRMVVATGVIFFLCLAPYEFFSALLMILTLNGNLVSAMQVCRMMMYLNSAINPFIYNVANPRYRRAFCLTFTCKPGNSAWRHGGRRQSARSREKNMNETSLVIRELALS